MGSRRRAALLTVVALALAACSGGYERLQPPDTTAPSGETTTTAGPPATIALEPVRGDRPPVPVGPGPLTIRGVVRGPEGPLPGASVRLERIVRDRGRATVDLVTIEDGTFELPGVLGGIWSVRAWRAPDLAMPTTNVRYVEDGQPYELDLVVDPFTGIAAAGSTNPEAATIDEPATVAVRVVRRSVREDGVVVGTPITGATVRLRGEGWQLVGTDAATTDGSGSAVFEVRCRGAGADTFVVTLPGGLEEAAFSVPPCQAPPPPEPDPTSPTGPGASSTTAPGATSTTGTTTTSSTSSTTSTTAGG